MLNLKQFDNAGVLVIIITKYTYLKIPALHRSLHRFG